MSRWVPVVALLGAIGAGPAGAAEWRMDPMASELLFQVSYQGEPAPGNFKKFETRFRFDPARPAEGMLNVKVQMTSIDLGSADLNDAVRGEEWLNLGKYADAEFRSNEIKRVAADQFVAKGTLQLKGMRQPVEVPFTWKSDGAGARMMGELLLDRGKFGIGTGEWANADPIGLGVKVRFNVRLVQAS